MFASFDWSAAIAAVSALGTLAIGAYVTIAMEKLKRKAEAAEIAAKRAERIAAQAQAEIIWVTKGGPEW